MKNVIRVLGIIAILAIIGLAVSCSVDPDEQTRITITDIPEGFEGKYATVAVVESMSVSVEDVKYLGAAKAGKVIKGGVAEAIPLFELKTEGKGDDMKMTFGEAVKVKQGYVLLIITETEQGAFSDEDKDLYTGVTDSAATLGEGTVEIKASRFQPDITKVAPSKPKANDYGTYTTSYVDSGTTYVETVVLSETEFKISDDTDGRTGANADHLYFSITSWEPVDLPTGYTDYTGAYKFTGKITEQKNYVPSSKTAPAASGFTTTSVGADVKADKTGTTCWMYIYFKGETGSITFIRSAFSKGATGTGVTADNKGIVTGGNNQARVYTKQVTP